MTEPGHRVKNASGVDEDRGAFEPPGRRPKVVAAILAYNVAGLLEKALARIPQAHVDAIFVMDNASTDGTAAVARRLGLTVFRNPRNLGYGGNVRAALGRAMNDYGADYMVEVHGDGAQFNPIALVDALPHLAAGAPFVMGSRFIEPGRALQNGMPWLRFVANRGLSLLARWILALPLTEFHSGFRIYSRSFAETLPLRENAANHLFSFQVLAQAAYFAQDVREVPVEADYNSAHTSISLWEATKYAVGCLRCLAQYQLAKMGARHSRIFPAGHMRGQRAVTSVNRKSQPTPHR